MITLKSEYENHILGHTTLTGAESYNYTWWRSINGSYAQIIFAISGMQSDLKRLQFFTFDEVMTSYEQRKYLSSNIYGTDSQDWTNVTTILPNYMLTDSNGGNLLTLANSFKDEYFAGVQQTAASLKAYMDSKYGNHAAYYYAITTGGNIYLDPSNRLQNVDSAYYAVDYCPNTAFSTFDPDGKIIWTGEEYGVPDDVLTQDALAAFLIFGEKMKKEKLAFDVYVDGVIGENGPNIAVKWHNTNPDTALSFGLLKPHVWGWSVRDYSGEPQVDPIKKDLHNCWIPDPQFMQMDTKYDWDSSGYQSDYVGAANRWNSGYSNIQRVQMYGPDGIPDHLRYYLRFDYTLPTDLTQVQGDLWYVDIPYHYTGAVYIEPHKVNDSIYLAPYDTEVNVIGGAPPQGPPDDQDGGDDGEDSGGGTGDTGPYDQDGYVDMTDGDSVGFPGNAVLTKTYALTDVILQNIGNKLWSQSYFDVLKIQTNPIENVISVKWFPMSLSGTSEEVQIGDVGFGVNGLRIGTMYQKTLNTYKYEPTSKRPGYLSCTPYSVVKLHLPYCGVVQLDASEIMYKTLGVKYVVDLVCGDIIVLLTLDGNPYMNVSGKMGVDIPLTATNRVQTELSVASRTLSAVMGASGHMLGGDIAGGAASAASGIISLVGMDYSTQRTSTHSPACASFENRYVFLEIIHCPARISEGYKSRHGYPSHTFTTLNNLSGFVKIDTRTTINVAMTEEENRMLEEIMTEGFYL